MMGVDVSGLLRRAGLRPTRQRTALATLLFGNGDRHVTAEILHEEAGWSAPEPAPALEPSFPHAAVELLQGHAGRSVALVGHEPHLSELASLLVSGAEHALRLELKKGATVLIAFDARPATGTGILRWVATPKILRGLDSST